MCEVYLGRSGAVTKQVLGSIRVVQGDEATKTTGDNLKGEVPVEVYIRIVVNADKPPQILIELPRPTTTAVRASAAGETKRH